MKGIFTWRIARSNQQDLPDPRIRIAQHLNWTRVSTTETTFSVPEPDSYNRAFRSALPVECKFIKDNVFYRDLQTDNWWNVYYVPEDKIKEFDIWQQLQPWDVAWRHNRVPVLRQRRHLLWVRNNLPDLSLNERLFTMGYYSDLSKKYFAEDDTFLLNRVGTARDTIYDLLE